MSGRGSRNQESRKATASHNNVSTKKQTRKGANPAKFSPAIVQSSDVGSWTSWTCGNSACRAILSEEDSFCGRCSCCICHRFDDNKDPSLWLVCESESGLGDSCGLSCHIECAFQQGKLGVVNLGQYMQLDGNYCCPSCGKISGILGCWKKQLAVAKDARRVDILCYRILLSYRLLDGTSRFEELLEVVREAKEMLEAEVGPLNGGLDKMARGIVSRLPIGNDVQKLCSVAIEKCEELLVSPSAGQIGIVDSLPAACRFTFEEVTSSSLFMILVEIPTPLSVGVKGYKLWYCKSRTEAYSKDPICTFTKKERRVLISNLVPCTEYSFRVVSYSENGDLGHSEAKCYTKSKEIVVKRINSSAAEKRVNPSAEGSSSDAKADSETEVPGTSQPGFRVRDMGKILDLAGAQEGRMDSFCSAAAAVKCCRVSQPEGQASEDDQSPPVSRGLDLNVPDLNEDITPPIESSRDEEDTGCMVVNASGREDDSASLANNEKNSHGSDSLPRDPIILNGDARNVGSKALIIRKRTSSSIIEEPQDCDSAMVNGSPVKNCGPSGTLRIDEEFEHGVETIRWLECNGYITPLYRLKFLTWFCLSSSEQERRVVYAFIQTLREDPMSLAAQLIDSFSEIISNNKRLRYGWY